MVHGHNRHWRLSKRIMLGILIGHGPGWTISLGIVVLILLLGLGCAHTRVTVEGQDRLPPSKLIAQEFSTTLRSELNKAIENGGPAGAIAVCQGISPRMEEQFTARYPEVLRVRRISLQTRNPQTHMPTVEEKRWLLSAQEAAQNKKPVEPGWIITRQKTTVLFPITINDPVCLLCHGEPAHMMEEVKTALRAHYPQDQATGYQFGDFRGALAIEWRN